MHQAWLCLMMINMSGSRLFVLVRRQDAAPRPYWLRDWQQGFGGFDKVYEYLVEGKVKKMYSVAYVIRPRTKDASACLCLTLTSKFPMKRPWKRHPGVADPSQSIFLDLQSASEWRMDSTVEEKFLEQMKHWMMTCKCSASLSTDLGNRSGCTRRYRRSTRSETLAEF